MTLLLLGTMFILMGLGVPIFAALGLSTVVVSTQHAMVFPLTIPQRMFFALDMFGLMAIPYFVFCADIMGRGKIGERLVLLCRAFLGHLPGGMAVAAVAACLVFGAISGAGVAALVAFGALVYRLMKEGQYTDEFSSGLIASSSTLAMLIPPSIVHVVFATITATSVAALFMSGLGMGLLLAIALATYSVIWAKWKKLPLLPKIPWRDRWKPLVSALPALGLIVVIMGGIYGGVLSVTEAAGVAAFYAFIVEVFVYQNAFV
jgi:C4-dicarboxylate transporter DctM subunit